MKIGYVRRLIIFIIAFLLFVASPLYYSDLLIIINCIVYFVITYDCWRLDRDDGMLISFNFFFLSILFICTYVYPLFVLKSDEIFLVLFSDGFVDKYMVKATSLVNLAVASFALGEHFGRRKNVFDSTYNTSFTQVQIIGKLEYVSFILYAIPLYLFILNKQENSDFTNYYLIDLSHAILYLSMIIKLSYYRKVCNHRRFLAFVMDNKKLFFIYSFIIP